MTINELIRRVAAGGSIEDHAADIARDAKWIIRFSPERGTSEAELDAYRRLYAAAKAYIKPAPQLQYVADVAFYAHRERSHWDE